MRRWLERIQSIMTNPHLDNASARQQVIALLGNRFSIPTSVATPKVDYNLRAGTTIAYLKPDVYHEVMGYLREGKKIQAIKAVRQSTGLGLKDAKDIVECDPQCLAAYRSPDMQMAGGVARRAVVPTRFG